MLTFARLSWSLLVFLLAIVGVGALIGHFFTALGVAAFVFVLGCLDGKPAWRWFFDPPGDVDSGRSSGRFFSWRRLGGDRPRHRR